MARRSLTPTLYTRPPCVCPDRPRCGCILHYKFKYDRARAVEDKGKPFTGSTGTANWSLATDIADKARAKVVGDSHGVIAPTTRRRAIPIAEVVAAFLEMREVDFPKVWKDDTTRCETFVALLPKQGATWLHTIGKATIEDWKKARAKMPKQRGSATVKRGTVNREFYTLQPLFRFAQERYGHPSPFIKRHVNGETILPVKQLNDDETEVVMPDDPELAKAFDLLPADISDLCRITYECLPRLAEVAMLRRQDIGPGKLNRRVKGGKRKQVEITATLSDRLLARLLTPDQWFVFPAFAALHQRRPRAISELIKRALRRIGLGHLSHHKFRHAGITNMDERGIAGKVIMVLAGWSSLKQLPRYTRDRGPEIRRAIQGNGDHLDRLVAARRAEKFAVVNQGGSKGGS